MILFPDETADALYAGVLAHPGDDLQRLVLADRMEEIGLTEWAEFVRLGGASPTEVNDAPGRNR